MNSTIKFAKVKEEATIPSKRDCDACFDLWSAEGDVVLKPHELKLIDTGIATAFDNNWVAIIKERSGMGSKGVAVRAGVIDSGYRNSWKVLLQNTTDNIITIPKEKAIAQFILLPVPSYTIETVEYDDLLNITSERGLNGFGSTDKQTE